jgi:hypothetical protein
MVPFETLSDLHPTPVIVASLPPNPAPGPIVIDALPSIARTSHPDDAPRRPAPASQALRYALWWANDGRCERCGRAMDRHLARIRRAYPDRSGSDAWALWCPWCTEDACFPIAWASITLPPGLIRDLLAQGPPSWTPPMLPRWFLAVFATGGILVPYRHWPHSLWPTATLWVPRIGHVQCTPQPQGQPPIIHRWRFASHAVLDAPPPFRPPARTRVFTDGTPVSNRWA